MVNSVDIHATNIMHTEFRKNKKIWSRIATGEHYGLFLPKTYILL